MIVKNVIPLTIRKNEKDLWCNSDLEAIAIIENNVGDLKETLRLLLLTMLKSTEFAISITWASDIITMNKINDIFTDSKLYKKFEPKGDFIVRSGAIITQITTSQDIMNLIEHWGTLDTIQIIFTPKDSREDILSIVCSENYIYNRRNFKIIDTVMKNSIIIINDSGDGEEFELIFHKKDRLIINELIDRLDYL